MKKKLLINRAQKLNKEGKCLLWKNFRVQNYYPKDKNKARYQPEKQSKSKGVTIKAAATGKSLQHEGKTVIFPAVFK